MNKFIKLTTDEIRQIINRAGYKLISKECLGFHDKITIRDKLNYYYISCLDDIKRGIFPKRFHPSNSYTIQNIKLWCILNNKPFKLLSDIYYGNNKVLKWQCFKDGCHEIFEASLGSIKSQNSGCSYCFGKKIGLSNCLATKNPTLASEWHPTKNGSLTPYDILSGSSKKVWWKCNNNPKHEWYSSPDNRNKHKNIKECPYCSHHLPSEDYNLLVINPEICEEWNYEKNDNNPEEYHPNSHDKTWWKCKDCNHEWEAKILDRNSGTGCPECNKSKGKKDAKKYL